MGGGRGGISGGRKRRDKWGERGGISGGGGRGGISGRIGKRRDKWGEEQEG